MRKRYMAANLYCCRLLIIDDMLFNWAYVSSPPAKKARPSNARCASDGLIHFQSERLMHYPLQQTAASFRCSGMLASPDAVTAAARGEEGER